jgi:hypothetical protein
MRYILDAAVLQANLLDRTLVIPSFVYARSCAYNMYAVICLAPIVVLPRLLIFICSTVCVEYATMVNKGDAIGWDEWRDLPYEQQMAFRIPITVMLDLPRLRMQYPVITASEYLRLHGLDPESESSSGFWLRIWYTSSPNVFESNKIKTPSQFFIENHWYDPMGINRVDHIPQAMKIRDKWERHYPEIVSEAAGYWPPEEQTDISDLLTSVKPEDKAILGWDDVKAVLRESRLGQGMDLNDDSVVESMLNVNGWEVLYTFESM